MIVHALALLIGVVAGLRAFLAPPDDLLDPVDDQKPRYPLELAYIVGDEHQTFAARMGPDQHIVGTAKRAELRQFGSYLPEMRSRSGRKRYDFESGCELFNSLKVRGPARGFLDAVQQLSEGDHRDAERLGKLIKPLPQGDRTVLDDVDADVRIEHILEHQSGSRS